MTEYNDYIRFKWNGKRYRWKKTRLFGLCLILMLIVTTVAIIHVNNICKQNIPIAKENAIKQSERQQEKIQSMIDYTNEAVEKAHKETKENADAKTNKKQAKTETILEQKIAQLTENEKEMPIYSSSPVKRYMDRTTVTDSSTKNYEICRNASVNDDGTLSYDGRTVIAIGQKYGKPGTKLDITLKNNDGEERVVKTIVGDSKKYHHTKNCSGWVASDGSVLEIVVDTNSINDISRIMGDMDYTPALNGSIIKIVKIKN